MIEGKLPAKTAACLERNAEVTRAIDEDRLLATRRGSNAEKPTLGVDPAVETQTRIVAMDRHFYDHHLAMTLLPHAFDIRDGAHDEAHLLRVWRNVEKIVSEEGGDSEILLAATLLHDCIWVDKASPERRMASRLAAAKAREILSALLWESDRINRVCHAIEAHSYSAGIEPVSLEAKILQDADRLDAMGFIGIARCLYLAGMRKASIYHITDPAAEQRPLDDSAYALDHFQTKLLKLGDNLRTETGRRMAAARSANLKSYYLGLLAEVG